MKFKLFFFVILVSSFQFLASPIFAQHFSSASYIIDWGNFNITSGKKNSANYSLTDTVGQNAPGQFNSSSYVVKAGFQYIYDSYNQFSFNIDNLSINLGSLVPGVASTATNIITITTPSGHGYQVIAAENHPLALATGTTIRDTTCDSGICTESVSSPWTSTSTYGFGFNAIGINTSGVATNIGTSDIFTDNTYFRQFANLANAEIPQTIMTENNPVKNHSAQITYKSVIASTQSAGQYQNSIIFTAVPKY